MAKKQSLQKKTLVCPNTANTNYIAPNKQGKTLIEVSARHVHLSRKHVEKLFGKKYQLTKLKELSQPGQFAANEKVTLSHKDRKIKRVRILGPERKQTQVELAITDCYALKMGEVPIRHSGELENTPGITIHGPKGKIELRSGVIVAKRHLHASVEEAKKLGIKKDEVIQVEVNQDERKTIFDDVVVRVDPSYKLAIHIDTDEGNAANLKFYSVARIIKKNGKRN
jgi:putative phosphotransacetylase